MIYMVLPAYNEEEALPLLLERIAEVRHEQQFELEVYVVDDGSQDRTAEVVQVFSQANPWAHVLPHVQNQGLAQGLRTGFQQVLSVTAHEDDILITLDADNTQPPEYIVSMKEKITAGADVVVASRFQPGAKVYGVPFMRRVYSQVMSALFQIILPIKNIRDYSCGYRAYRVKALRLADDTYGADFITEDGFACMVEILVQLNRLQELQFEEVPFTLHYDWKPTPTKMKVLKTITETLALALRYRTQKNPVR